MVLDKSNKAVSGNMLIVILESIINPYYPQSDAVTLSRSISPSSSM